MQVEFGAHQVILGRTKESLDSLPQHLRDSNVIKMLVGQSKGLEFDDVFLWDFFNGSPADWRPLNNFTSKLEEIERTQGPKKLPAGTPLVNVSFDFGALCRQSIAYFNKSVQNCSGLVCSAKSDKQGK